MAWALSDSVFQKSPTGDQGEAFFPCLCYDMLLSSKLLPTEPGVHAGLASVSVGEILTGLLSNLPLVCLVSFCKPNIWLKLRTHSASGGDTGGCYQPF